MSRPMVLGIDIAKHKFDIALVSDGQVIARGQFSNNRSGFKRFFTWLTNREVARVWACLEATGRYGEPLALALHEQGHQVSIVNPAQIKRYAESKLQRNKTDQMDAALIGDFCDTQKPDLWTPLSRERRWLQEMVRRLNSLIVERTRELNRRQAGFESPVVLDSIEANIHFLSTQIAHLEQQIQAHIDQDPALSQEQQLLVSIVGIGPRSAARILGELVHAADFKQADQVVAYAGLSVKHQESGHSVKRKPKLSKVGNAHLRTALYFPAISAIRFNPIIKALAERLRSKGKLPMEIIGAAMRKLLRLVFGVLKTRLPFDPEFVTNQHVLT